MKDYIYRLRQKPEETRKQYVFFFIAIFMSLVIGLWIYSLTHKFSSPSNQNDSIQVSEDIKPFKMFANTIKDTYQNAKASAVDPFTKNDTPSNVKQSESAENKAMIPLIVVDNPQE